MDKDKLRYNLRKNFINFKEGSLSKPQFNNYISDIYKQLKTEKVNFKTEIKKDLSFFRKKL